MIVVTWPNSVVDAQEEDKVLGWVDVHYLYKIMISESEQNSLIIVNYVKISPKSKS